VFFIFDAGILDEEFQNAIAIFVFRVGNSCCKTVCWRSQLYFRRFFEKFFKSSKTFLNKFFEDLKK